MKTIQNCGRCGLCLTVCPVYSELKEECSSPRARLQLIRLFENSTLDSSLRLKQIVSQCLMCGSCAAICPSGIDHYSRFMEMRRKMVQNHGESPAIKSLIWLLAKEYRMRVAGKVAKRGQKLIPELFKQRYQLGNISLNHFPGFNATPFRESLPELVEPYGTPRGSVIYFTGCATNYLFEDTGSSAVNILKQMGYRIIIPRAQTCCSIPMLFHGALDEARENILANIRALTPATHVEAIIVDCATCGTALKREYPALLADMGGKDKGVGGDLKVRNGVLNSMEITRMASEIAEKTTDLISFIEQRSDLLLPLLDGREQNREDAGQGNIDGKYKLGKVQKTEQQIIKSGLPTTVTYHAPCHLKNSSSGYLHVERVLRALPSVEYRPALDVDQCCGGGGTFFYEHPEISSNMVTKKIFNAEKSGADLWLTDCPVCRINLAGNMGNISDKGDLQNGKGDIKRGVPVIHPATLISRILR